MPLTTLGSFVGKRNGTHRTGALKESPGKSRRAKSRRAGFDSQAGTEVSRGAIHAQVRPVPSALQVDGPPLGGWSFKIHGPLHQIQPHAAPFGAADPIAIQAAIHLKVPAPRRARWRAMPCPAPGCSAQGIPSPLRDYRDRREQRVDTPHRFSWSVSRRQSR